MAGDASTKVVLAALACNAGIAAAKFAASLLTGSSAMLSEAVHSLIDTSNQALMLYGLRRAARPADKAHPFGYEHEIYFWSFVVAILLFALGAGVSIYEGVGKLARPTPLVDPEINYLVLAVSLVLEIGSATVAIREFNKTRGDRPLIAALRASKDPSIFTILLEDMAAIAGLVVAFIGVIAAHVWGVPEADGAASIVIGLILAMVAAFVAIEVKSLLTGEAASDEINMGVAGLLYAEAGRGTIQRVHDIRTLQLGPKSVLVTARLDVADQAAARDVESVTGRVGQDIRTRFPDVRHVYLDVQASDGKRMPTVNTVPVKLDAEGAPAVASGPAAAEKPPMVAKSLKRQPGRGKRRR